MIVLLAACAHTTKPLNPDLEQIAPWSQKLGNEQLASAPYLVHFQRGKFQLYYLASKHENQTESQTFDLVRNFFDRFPDIKFVLLEGVPWKRGISPPKYIE